jgi:hypothetical protein
MTDNSKNIDPSCIIHQKQLESKCPKANPSIFKKHEDKVNKILNIESQPILGNVMFDKEMTNKNSRGNYIKSMSTNIINMDSNVNKNMEIRNSLVESNLKVINKFIIV